MLRVDKIILAILAIEHLGFGIYGFFSPEGIAELTGYGLNSEFAFSEIRAYYTLISGLGLMAFLAIFFHKLARQTYILFSFMFVCFANSFFHDLSFFFFHSTICYFYK